MTKTQLPQCPRAKFVRCWRVAKIHRIHAAAARLITSGATDATGLATLITPASISVHSGEDDAGS